MLLGLKSAGKWLRHLPRASFSYFENFTEKINPPPNAPLSYHNPKYRRRETIQKYQVPLDSFARQLTD